MPGNNSQQFSVGGVPALIKCSVCQEERDSQKHFSEKQINDYKKHHKTARLVTKEATNNVKKPADLYIRCRTCVGVRREEMRCRICRKTKVMDWFSLAQRKDPDNARCRDCMHAIEAVLPTSSSIGESHRLDIAGDGDNDEEISSYMSKKDGDHFFKTVAGEYWTGRDSEASSVSNPWNSRAASEVGLRGPISSRESASEFNHTGSLHSTGTKITTRGRGKRSGASGGNTSTNMAALTNRLQTLDVDAGIPNKTLARVARAESNNADDSEDSDSNKSDETVRNDGGVSLSTTGVSQDKKSTRAARTPNYDDSDGDDDDDYHLYKPVLNKAKINLYDEDDHNGEQYDPVSTTTGKQYQQGDFNTRTTTGQSFGAPMLTGFASYASGTANSGMDDWKEGPRLTTTYASGFKDRHYKNQADASNPRKFARVRPMNMRLVDLEKSYLNREHKTEEPTNRRRNRRGADSDEE